MLFAGRWQSAQGAARGRAVTKATSVAEAIPRLSLRPAEAAASLGLSLRKMEQMIAAGALPVVRVGRCRLLPVAGLRRWLREQVEVHTAPAAREDGADGRV